MTKIQTHLQTNKRNRSGARTDFSFRSFTRRGIILRMSSLPSVTDSELHQLVETAEAWALGHGVVMRDAAGAIHHAPFSLYPVRVPRSSFETLRAMCTLFNTLVDRYSRDLPFIEKSLQHVILADAFTKRLLELYRRVIAEGIAQPLYLGVHRADYLLHAPPASSSEPVFLQVEVNTISSAFAGLSTQVSRLHRFMLERHIHSSAYPADALPVNEPVNEVADALALAVRQFLKSQTSITEAVVMMVVQPNERNTADQRAIEYALWDRHRVPVIRRTLADIAARGVLHGIENDELQTSSAQSQPLPTRALSIDGQCVGVAYYRAGYTPNDYPTELEWQARERIERSTAIKCPPVAYQLAGTKKLQQALASPGVVEHYLNADEAALVRKCFAGLWSLDADGGDMYRNIVQQAIADPESFVLKPQREGGGNNFFHQELADKLASLSDVERAEFILMQRIEPPLLPAVLVRQSKVTQAPAASELGIYGVYLGDGSTEHLNRIAGHLVRTKPGGVDEGGVAAGYAYLDSPLLVDKV